MAQQTEIDMLKAENESLKAENERIKAKYNFIIADTNSRQAFRETFIDLTITDKDGLRIHMDGEGWTKGKTEEQIAEMVESAHDFAMDNIQSLIDTDEIFETVMEEWWHEAEEEFKPKAE